MGECLGWRPRFESEGEVGMNINIEKLLSENTGVSDHKIVSTRTESYELFFVHEKLETVRSTDTTNTDVTVYVDHDGKRGNANFKLYAATSESEAAELINTAVKNALCVDNEYYELPKNEKLDGKVESNFEDYEPKTLASLVAKSVFSAEMLEKGSINALEVFIYKYTVNVKNSQGIDKREVKYRAMVEAIPTWTDGESVELYECKTFNNFDPEDVKHEIEEKMREVRDRGRAVHPQSQLNCKVVLKASELSQLLGEITYNADYSSVYSHSNLYSLGDKIQKDDTPHDNINVTMCGAIKGSSASALFDADGTTLKDTELIKDGAFVSYYGASRFAQYLNLPATGALPCVKLGTGTLTDEMLKSEPYFECVSMSGLQVDPYSDYIGGEVRLAYYCDGDNITPLTGISISGKLSDALSSVRFSTEQTCSGYNGSYIGPKLASFDGIKIV